MTDEAPMVRRMTLEEMSLAWRAKEAADPVSPKYTPLADLAGTVICGRRDDEAPGTPLRPFRTEPSVQPTVTHDQIRFSFQTYTGTLLIGFEHPWCRRQPKSKVITQQRGWVPWLSWSMSRPIEERGVMECHLAWDRDVRRDASWDSAAAALVDTLDRTLDPEMALSNRRFVYRLDSSLISAFDLYLTAYLQRPAVQVHIRRMAQG